MTGIGDVVDAAMATAADAARASGVTIRPVATPAGHHEVAELFATVWQAPAGQGPVRAGTMRAAQHVGAHVVGAHPVDRVVESPDQDASAIASVGMVAASFGFHAADGHLHSHVTGTLADWRGRGIGLALKLQQRAWCLEHGVDRITWTFDPLVRRNAWFNLRRLGVVVSHYLPSFYGPMGDGINAGDDTDRVLVAWHLADPATIATLAGTPTADTGPDPGRRIAASPTMLVSVVDGRPRRHDLPAGPGRCVVCLPADIEGLRHSDMALALQWRRVVRDGLVDALGAGWRIIGMTDDGNYLLEHP